MACRTMPAVRRRCPVHGPFVRGRRPPVTWPRYPVYAIDGVNVTWLARTATADDPEPPHVARPDRHTTVRSFRLRPRLLAIGDMGAGCRTPNLAPRPVWFDHLSCVGLGPSERPGRAFGRSFLPVAGGPVEQRAGPIRPGGALGRSSLPVSTGPMELWAGARRAAEAYLRASVVCWRTSQDELVEIRSAGRWRITRVRCRYL
jgi:hypothetical protein